MIIASQENPMGKGRKNYESSRNLSIINVISYKSITGSLISERRELKVDLYSGFKIHHLVLLPQTWYQLLYVSKCLFYFLKDANWDAKWHFFSSSSSFLLFVFFLWKQVHFMLVQLNCWIYKLRRDTSKGQIGGVSD